MLAGDGLTLEIVGDREAIDGLDVVFPDGLAAVSPLARIPRQGRAFVEFIAEQSGEYEIVLKTGGKTLVKTIVAGDEVSVRAMQPERVSSAFEAILWPAEDTLTGTGLEKISFVYPESDLGWLPLSGPLGVLAAFVLASMVVGFIFLKPLGVQI